jgi:heme/copper-type cytochrome/quinol oxidase subunit 2
MKIFFLVIYLVCCAGILYGYIEDARREADVDLGILFIMVICALIPIVNLVTLIFLWKDQIFGIFNKVIFKKRT